MDTGTFIGLAILVCLVAALTDTFGELMVTIGLLVVLISIPVGLVLVLT